MKKSEREGWASLWREALQATSLGWDLALPIFGGVLLGYALDRWLGTRHIFTLGLMVLGVGVGFYNVARFIQRIDAREREQAARNAAGEGEGENSGNRTDGNV